MNTKSFMLLLASAPLYAMEQPQKSLSDAFEPTATFFDDVVHEWYKNMFGSEAQARTHNENPNFVPFCKELDATNLHELCANKNIAEQAKKYWTTISSDPQLLGAYHNACAAYQINEGIKNRGELFAMFRNEGIKKSQDLMRQELYEKKEDEKEAKIKFKAFMAIDFGFRQIHRNIDKESDSDSLLIHPLNKETESQKK